MKNSITSDKRIRKAAVLLIWLAVWELVTLCVHNKILIVGPFDVLLTLIRDLKDAAFYKSISVSFLRLLAGYFAGCAAGILLAAAASKSDFIRELLKPVIIFMKAAPVASFVVLFLIWWHSDVLSIAICICVVLPQIYISLLEGIDNTDPKLKEMAEIFEFSFIDRVDYIYRPQAAGYMQGAVKVSSGMAVKAAVAAEVIATAGSTIGEKLYMSKIYLDTAGVLAWTLVIIGLGAAFEKILVLALDRYCTCEMKVYGPSSRKRNKGVRKGSHKAEGAGDDEASGCDALDISGLFKSYGDKKVLKDYSAHFEKGNIYTFDWPSGVGKTTLFRIIAGLDAEDAGTVIPKEQAVSMVFQEDRLIEGFSAIVNVSLACGDVKKAEEILLKLLDEDDIHKPAGLLSGGQKRRCAIARALVREKGIAIFDEPYEGLDAELRCKVRKIMDDFGSDKIILMASHIDNNV